MRSLATLAAVAGTCNALGAQGERAGFVDEGQSFIRDAGRLPLHNPLGNLKAQGAFSKDKKKDCENIGG